MADYGTVVGYFPTHAGVASAIQALKQAGFAQDQIGIAAQSTEADGFAQAADTTAEEGTAYKAGHSAGHAWESIKSFFGGDSPDHSAGEVSQDTLNDRVTTEHSYASDDIHHSLTGLSVPSEHARYFGHQLGAGDQGAVITVHAQGREAEARDVLVQAGADVGDGAEAFDYGAAAAQSAGSKNIQLFGEVLRVHKDRVSSGEARLRKDVTTTVQTVQVPVTHEELVVERVPVSGQPVAGDTAFAGEELRVPLTEERVVVDKQPVVREEVRIGTKDVTNIESFHEQVRSEDLVVDEGAVPGKKV